MFHKKYPACRPATCKKSRQFRLGNTRGNERKLAIEKSHLSCEHLVSGSKQAQFWVVKAQSTPMHLETELFLSVNKNLGRQIDFQHILISVLVFKLFWKFTITSIIHFFKNEGIIYFLRSIICLLLDGFTCMKCRHYFY